MLKGLGHLGDMAKMMKQAQEMQSKMAEAAGAARQHHRHRRGRAGLVKATATAKGELRALSIDPSIFVRRTRGGRGPDPRRDQGRAGPRRRGRAAGDGKLTEGSACRRHEAAVLTMAETPREIERLIALMARLPGLGPRSARRAVLHLMRKREMLMAPLARRWPRWRRRRATARLRQHRDRGDLRDLRRSARATGEICVVEERGRSLGDGAGHVFRAATTCWAGHAVGARRGGARYAAHPRAGGAGGSSEGVTEVILALNATVDGQTTAHYIADALARRSGVAVTSLAQGVPMGGELDYLDDGTIGAALRARRLGPFVLSTVRFRAGTDQ
jgi:recombination protein RecR